MDVLKKLFKWRRQPSHGTARWPTEEVFHTAEEFDPRPPSTKAVWPMLQTAPPAGPRNSLDRQRSGEAQQSRDHPVTAETRIAEDRDVRTPPVRHRTSASSAADHDPCDPPPHHHRNLATISQHDPCDPPAHHHTVNIYGHPVRLYSSEQQQQQEDACDDMELAPDLTPTHIKNLSEKPRPPEEVGYWRLYTDKMLGRYYMYEHEGNKWYKHYDNKEHPRPTPRDSPDHILVSILGSFLGILFVALLHFRVINSPTNQHPEVAMLTFSFGASAVLIYGRPGAELSSPRNFMGGHCLSAIVGCSVRALFDLLPEPARLNTLWLAAALAVALAIAVMQLTRTVHPPGGATALTASVVGVLQPAEGYLFVLTPILSGTLIMLAVALVVNNLPRNRHYPSFWW
eukprot:jgi/Chlat1/6572/Chrsp45S05937